MRDVLVTGPTDVLACRLLRAVGRPGDDGLDDAIVLLGGGLRVTEGTVRRRYDAATDRGLDEPIQASPCVRQPAQSPPIWRKGLRVGKPVQPA